MIAISKKIGQFLIPSQPGTNLLGRRISSVLKASTTGPLLIIAGLGLATFFTGLHNPFIGDDIPQIVSSPTTHSIAHIIKFFTGGTLDSGTGAHQLVGNYYRPLMTTTFALVYTAFGAQPLAFHLLQLLLAILATFMLFVVFRYFFKPVLALILSLVFLVHPINSQAVFSISDLQEPLFLLFGLCGFWFLLRYQYKGNTYLIPVVTCLFLSLLSKESGALFVCICVVYEFFFDRKRFYPFAAMLAGVITLYVALKMHAVGFPNPHNAPIDELAFWQRMINVPAIISFYIDTFVFPLHIAHAYYWAYTSISIRHFALPLVEDILALISIVAAGLVLRRKSKQKQLLLFAFFAAWLIFGLLLHIQVIPLDYTVCDSWFCFSFIGLLGMIGTMVDAFPPRRPMLLIFTTLTIISVLALRTSLRGLDYSSRYILASRDVAISSDDYVSQTDVAIYLMSHGQLLQALQRAQDSVNTYPSTLGYDTLGLALFELKQYSYALQALNKAVQLNDESREKEPYVDEHIATLALYYGDRTANINRIRAMLQDYPQDGKLWLDLAILQYPLNKTAARYDISNAAEYGQLNPYFYDRITNNEPILLNPPTVGY